MAIEWQVTAGGIEEATAASASEFIEALRPSNQHWWEDGTCPWVFRGHAREEWRLLPSAWRPENVIMRNSTIEASRRFDQVRPPLNLNWFWYPNVWSSAATFGDNDDQLAKQLVVAATAEYIPLWDFANGCDELGMPVPLANPGPEPSQDPNWLAVGAGNPLVCDNFLRFNDLPPTLALAQHHGIPTRLLDWTRNPIAAAYFAVEPLRELKEDAKLVVWAIHKRRATEVSVEGVSFPNAPRGSERFDSGIAVVRPSTRDNPFLAAQSGLFTTISLSGIYFMKSNGTRPAIEQFVAEANPLFTVLRKLILRHENAPDLAEILRRENVSRSALMPTMDNVASDVRRKWSSNL